MCLTCKIATSGGDMASRMHICLDRKIPVSPFIGINIILSEYREKLGISETEIAYIAFGTLIKRKTEFKVQGRIYFCEDHFEDDLIRLFETMLGNNLEKKKEKKNTTQRIFEKFGL